MSAAPGMPDDGSCVSEGRAELEERDVCRRPRRSCAERHSPHRFGGDVSLAGALPTDTSAALNPSMSIADASFWGVCFLSSYVTRASPSSSFTSACLTPGSLSKAAAMFVGQA